MIKVKLSELILNRNEIEKLFSKEFSAKNSFILSKMQRKIKEHLCDFDEQNRKKIISLGKDDGKGAIFVTEENRHQYNKEIEEIGNMEVDIDFEKIPQHMFDMCNISPEIINKLHFLIAE